MSSFLLISFSSVLILVLAIMSSFFRNSIFTDSGLGFGLAFLLFCEIAAGAGSDGVEFMGAVKFRDGMDVVGVNVKEVVVAGAGSDGVEFTGGGLDVVGVNVKEAVVNVVVEVLGWNGAAVSERGCVIVMVLTGIDVDMGSCGVVDGDDKDWAIGCGGGGAVFSSSMARKLVIPMVLFLELVEKEHLCFL